MPITLTAGSGTPIKLGKLTDLENSADTYLSLGPEFETYLQGPISGLPDSLLCTNLQYTSGNQKWTLGTAAPVCFTLSGGVTGKITVIKSETIFSYTDSFPTEVTLSLSTTKGASPTKPMKGPSGSVHLCVELDLSIQAGISISYKSGIYGITGSASTSDTFQVAFYKNCQLGDLLGQSIAIALGDMVLPFHANTLNNLKVNDFLKHTANANLQLGLGASIGFSCFSFADQWKSAIPGVAGSPSLCLGVTPKAQPTVKLAYSFSYAGTFEQLLWVDVAQHAHLHLYKSDKQTQSLDFTAGITASANTSAATKVQAQIANAPANASPGTSLATTLTSLFQNFSTETGKLSSEINDKITALLKPLNQSVQTNLDVNITATKQKFQLLNYDIDLTNPAYAAAWTYMVNGQYQDAIDNSNGSVQLDPGSGLEQLYSKTASIKLNFFGQAVANWSKAQIANSSLIYAGNNIFHLMTVDGVQRLAKINKSSTEIDCYFAQELDLSAAAPTLKPPTLNMILRAQNNEKYGAYIAGFISLLNQGQDGNALASQVTKLASAANTTQVLQIVFQPSAYGKLASSTIPLTAGSDQDDTANYAAFAWASAQLMPPSPSQFSYSGRQLTYDFWTQWNIALTNAWPAPAGALPDRTQSGTILNGFVQAYLDSEFGANTPLLSVSTPLRAASSFMNLCANLQTLANAAVDAHTWDAFANSLLAIINRDMDLDFVAPATLALTKLCGNAMPQQTVGPAQGLAGTTSIAVTMSFA